MKNQASIQLLKVGTPINPNADTGHIMLCADADGNLRIFGENGVELPIGSAVDESRLVPTGGRNGNILGYQEGADRGNNVNTKLLLQPVTSDGQIVDQAAGNAAPVDITNSGNVAIEANALVFSGENSLLIPANALGMTLGGDNEFTIDIEFQLDSVKSDYATLYGMDGSPSSGRGALYFTSSGAATFTDSLGPNTTGWTLGTKHRITIERWNDNGTWKTSVYRNGSFLASSTAGMNILSNYAFPIGSNNEGTGRNFVGKIWAFRISNKAEHRGVSFTPRELPFLPPAGQPVWTEGIDRSRLLPALDSVPVNRSGNPVVFKAVSEGMDAHTLLYCPFDADFNDHTAAGGQFIQTGRQSESITTDDKKFGAGSLNCGSNYNTYLNGPLAKPIGTADCTIHCWAKFNELNGRGPFALLTAAISKDLDFWGASMGCIALSMYSDSVVLQKYRGSNGIKADIINVSTSLSIGVWHHFAVVRSGNTWYLFLDGELIGTGVNDTVVSSSFIRIGGNGQYTMNGLIDEFIVLDYAKWISDFTPPAAPASSLVKSYEISEQPTGTVKSVNGATPDSSGAVTLPEATASAAGLMAAADKAKLDGISTSEAWYTVADAAAITLDRANGELQKVTLTHNCVLTAPVLDADHSTLLLQVTSSSAVTVTVGETNIVTDHTGTFQVGWYWDGEATRRYPAVEIS